MFIWLKIQNNLCEEIQPETVWEIGDYFCWFSFIQNTKFIKRLEIGQNYVRNNNESSSVHMALIGAEIDFVIIFVIILTDYLTSIYFRPYTPACIEVDLGSTSLRSANYELNFTLRCLISQWYKAKPIHIYKYNMTWYWTS